MRKSLITIAVLGALIAPSFVFAADAAPAPDLTVAYNVGLYSQYIFRGLTQTDKMPAIQGGVDLAHSSGFYLGAWASNISWLKGEAFQATTPATSFYKKGGNIEMDIYGGYKHTFDSIGSGLGIDVGVLQYYYPGTLNADTAKADTTELYGAVSYGWVQAKLSDVVSKGAWTVGKTRAVTGSTNAQGTYYADITATIPVSDLIGARDGLASGISAIAHVGRQEFNAGKVNDVFSYTDYKLGLQKTFENGLNVGGYWTSANTNTAQWLIDGKNIGNDTGTVYVQKTF
jgi:uncharacterized protein (TIGR02001 family)